MDNREAREILKLYRPGSTDADDPRMAEALELARQDPELKTWLDQHGATYEAIRNKLKAIPIPPGLDRRIIAYRAERARRDGMLDRMKLLAVAAAIALLAAGAWFWFNTERSAAEAPNTLANYEDHMAGEIERGYLMQVVSSNRAEVVDYLKKGSAPAEQPPSRKLAEMSTLGGAVINWHQANAGLICLNAGGTTNVWLFVIASNAIPDAPAAGTTNVAKIRSLTTATWTFSGNTYLLASRTSEAELRQYLP